jgi:putative MATE family efflux protein
MLSPVEKPAGTSAALLRLVWPVLIEQVLVMLVGFSDTILAGRYLDEEHLAAMTVLSYLLWALNNLFSFVSIGTTAMVARFVGAGELENANRSMNQSFVIGAIWAAVITTAGLLFAPRVIESMQLEGVAVAFAVRYLRFLLPVIPFMMLESVGIAALRGAGDMVTGLVAMIVVNAVNIGVSWLFLTGAGPFPQIGWDGIAIGTACGHVMGGLIPCAVLMRGRRGLRIQPGMLRLDLAMARRVLRIGVPGGVDVFSINVCQIIFLSIVNLLGFVATAAHGVAIRIESLAYLPGYAFQLATATLTGQQLGARQPHRALRTVLVACAWNGAFMTFAGFGLYFGADWLLHAFLGSEQADVAALGAPLLRIIAFAMPALATLQIMTGALRGAGDTRLPLVITLLGFLGVRIPLAICLAFWLDWGIEGAWYAMVIDLFVRSALIALRFSVGAWRHVEV